MRKLIYYVGMTIDGRIAGPDGSIDFFPLGEVMGWISEHYPETLPVPVREQIGLDTAPKHFDTILMGRVTYQPALDLGVPAIYAPLRHYIVSSTLGPVDDDLVTVVPGAAPALVRRLKAEDGADLYLAGGGRLAGSLLSEIDRLVVKLYPVVANAGVPVFSGDFAPTAFTLRGSEPLADGVTILTYDRA
jgi:dihydrofolate reductase